MNTILLVRACTTVLFSLTLTLAAGQPPLRSIDPEVYYRDLLGGNWCGDNGSGSTSYDLYFNAYEDFLVTALHGNDSVFEAYFDRMDSRLESLGDGTPFEIFMQAEFMLQEAFIELKSGNELTAAWKLRQAYKLSTSALEEYPGFGPIRKTLGVMQCLIGSIPENMQWIPGVFGIRGTIDEGINNLTQSCADSPWLCTETDFLLALCHSYLLSENDKAVRYGENALVSGGMAPLPAYLMMNIYLRAHQADKALEVFSQLEPVPCGDIPQLYYLAGNAWLQKGDYTSAREAFAKFLDSRTSEDFTRDSWYKSGLSWWLDGDRTRALQHFERALSTGTSNTEADRYAEKHASSPLPDREIMKVRLYTDGGYYDKARELLSTVSPVNYTNPESKTELVYRKARLAHLTGDTLQAVSDYKNTIALQDGRSWYYAPNACLQLGYLLTPADKENARLWFSKVKEYRGYEYEKGIERKAQAALNHLD